MGTIHIDGRDVTWEPAHARDIGMVFQNYALFPHMTVRENIAFPLRARRWPRTEIEPAVQRALDLVQLGAFSDRAPTELSGGQQQRVALARAIVYQPKMLLMDEPLGALDRKLRSEMQIEIKKLHRELGTTFLYVTHDQEEALSMSDRIAILRHGRLEQIGTPQEVYDNPGTEFVAGFVGDISFLPGVVTPDGRGAQLRDVASIIPLRNDKVVRPDTPVVVAFRPEHIALAPSNAAANATVEEVLYLGNVVKVIGSVAGTQVKATMPAHGYIPNAGDRVVLSLDADSGVVFFR
jgi:ABC-type Fe3+/spermidine/putrescine transport system ATPase subunit